MSIKGDQHMKCNNAREFASNELFEILLSTKTGKQYVLYVIFKTRAGAIYQIHNARLRLAFYT